MKIIGVLKSLEEKKDKNGSSYIFGLLATGDKTLAVKMWSMTKEKLYKMVPQICVGAITSMDVDEDTYKGETSYTIKTDEHGLPMIAIDEVDDISKYIAITPIPTEKMFANIRGDVEKWGNETLKRVGLTVLDICKDKLLYYPYSEAIHSEKGGLLYHIFLTYCNVLKVYEPHFTNGAQVVRDKELILSSLITEVLGVAQSEIKVHPSTGVITTPKEDTQFFKAYGNMGAVIRLTEILTVSGLSATPEAKCLLHIAMVKAGVVEPACIEATISRDASISELNKYKAYENVRNNGLQPFELW